MEDDVVFPFWCGDVTIELKFLNRRCSKHSSEESKRFTKLHFTAETDDLKIVPRSRMSCQSSGSARCGSTM